MTPCVATAGQSMGLCFSAVRHRAPCQIDFPPVAHQQDDGLEGGLPGLRIWVL